MGQFEGSFGHAQQAGQPAGFHPTASVLEAPRHGIDVAWHTTRAGTVQLQAAAEHRIRMHSGAPIAGFCGKQRFVYTSGDLDLMPAGYADSWQEDSDGTSLFLGLSPRLLHRAAEELGIDSSHAALDLHHQFRDPQIEHIAWALEAERRGGYDNGALYRESLGLALSVHLLRRYAKPQPVTKGLPPARLRRLMAYIEEHLEQELSLIELAAVAGVSASHLKTLFRRSTGQPVHQYVMRQRVERARQLLERGKLPISQVALDAGFAHQSHLARCMRRILGVTPAALRRTHAD